MRIVLDWSVWVPIAIFCILLYHAIQYHRKYCERTKKKFVWFGRSAYGKILLMRHVRYREYWGEYEGIGWGIGVGKRFYTDKEWTFAIVKGDVK